MMDDSSESGEDGEEGEEGDSCKDELPPPGACYTREGRVSDKTSESASEESKAIPPGASPTVPGMNTNYTTSLQKSAMTLRNWHTSNMHVIIIMILSSYTVIMTGLSLIQRK